MVKVIVGHVFEVVVLRGDKGGFPLELGSDWRIWFFIFDGPFVRGCGIEVGWRFHLVFG